MNSTISGFSANGPGWLQVIAAQLAHGQPLYMLLYALMIIFFSYFYTAVVFNPEETADNLKKYGGFIPGIRPGSATAQYFDRILTRLTTVDYDERVALDRRYVEHHSVWLDLQILFKTIKVVAVREGAR